MALVIKRFFLVTFMLATTLLHSQTLEYHDKRGNSYYKQKKYALAITEWIKALEIDPDNVKIQKKIEQVYEVKREKDLAMEKSKKFLRFARKSLEEKDPESGKRYSDRAINHFITAYRADPNDTDLIILKDRLRRISKQAEIDLERQRLDAQRRKIYEKEYQTASKLMEEKRYKDAIPHWDKMLEVFPNDDIAKKGKRTANLAIQSRLRFEQIKKFMEKGRELFEDKEYVKALEEFQEVIKLDPGNPEAENYIAQIDELIEEREAAERKRIQAERFYQSGRKNTDEYQFDAAREDYETVLSLIDNYKDTVVRLSELDALEKEYVERIQKENLRKINIEFQNGLLALMQGENKKAIASFQNILKIDPNNEQAKKYIKMAKEALELEREDIVDKDSPYYGLVQSLIVSGKKLYEAGKYEESLLQWERILNLFPKNAIATEYLLKCRLKLNPELYDTFAQEQIEEGKEFLKKKSYKRALRKFAIIKAITPDYPGIDNLIKQSKPEKPTLPIVPSTASLPDSTKAQVAPELLVARYNRGLSNYQSGNLQQALADFRYVATNDPQNVRAIININKIESELRFASGKSVKKNSGKQLTSEQKSLIRRYYFRGINYYSKNRFPEAISEWRKVLQIDPQHEKAKNNIRKCLLLMKQ